MPGARHAGTHRAAPASRAVRLGLALLGVSGVAVLVAIALHSTSPLSAGANKALRTQDASTTGVSSATATPGPEETGPEPTAAPTVAPTGAPTVAPTGAGPTVGEAPKLALLVLNNSRINHLATRAAQDFRAGGWPIRDTGNFTGRVATTTVYYGPGEEASARRLAAQFPKVRRVAPRFAGLPGDGLTVVVTRDYAGR